MAFIGAEDISEFDITHTGDILHQHGKKLFQCDKALAKYCEQIVHHMRHTGEKQMKTVNVTRLSHIIVILLPIWTVGHTH